MIHFPALLGFARKFHGLWPLSSRISNMNVVERYVSFSACPTSWCSTCLNSACSRPVCFLSAAIAIWERGFFAGWWFGTFSMFPYIGNNTPNWVIFFRGVETTNQFGKGGSFSGSVLVPQVIVALWWLSSRWPVPWRLLKKRGSSFLLWYYIILYTIYIYMCVCVLNVSIQYSLKRNTFFCWTFGISMIWDRTCRPGAIASVPVFMSAMMQCPMISIAFASWQRGVGARCCGPKRRGENAHHWRVCTMLCGAFPFCYPQFLNECVVWFV